VHLARLAGVPRAVLARAEAVLAALEARARQGGGAHFEVILPRSAPDQT